MSRMKNIILVVKNVVSNHRQEEKVVLQLTTVLNGGVGLDLAVVSVAKQQKLGGVTLPRMFERPKKLS